MNWLQKCSGIIWIFNKYKYNVHIFNQINNGKQVDKLELYPFFMKINHGSLCSIIFLLNLHFVYISITKCIVSILCCSFFRTIPSYEKL